MDRISRIMGNVKAWRAAFPFARAVNVSRCNDFVDADFVHIRGDARVRLQPVNISYCWCKVTDADCLHLRGIRTLDMSCCTRAGDYHRRCFCTTQHLRGMSYTQNVRLQSDNHHVRGIHTLEIWRCCQLTITDVAFVHLRGIHTLNLLRSSDHHASGNCASCWDCPTCTL